MFHVVYNNKKIHEIGFQGAKIQQHWPRREREDEERTDEDRQYSSLLALCLPIARRDVKFPVCAQGCDAIFRLIKFVLRSSYRFLSV